MATHFDYFTRELTVDNVFEASLPFGDSLELKEGKFIFTSVGGKETVISLEDVRGVDIGDGILHSRIQLVGENIEGRDNILLDMSMIGVDNLDVIRYVVELANNKINR
jgi:hypothetical protein